jgi:hypothetical protein
MSNFKMKCAKCGTSLGSYRMELMQGPKGFRTYAVCVVCPPKKGLKGRAQSKVVR